MQDVVHLPPEDTEDETPRRSVRIAKDNPTRTDGVPDDQWFKYTVQKENETPKSIAQKFGIPVATILQNNQNESEQSKLTSKSRLKKGFKLWVHRAIDSKLWILCIFLLLMVLFINSQS